MTPAQDMATRSITNVLTIIAKIDNEIRWHKTHPGKTAAAKRASKVTLALLNDRRTQLVAMVRRIEVRNKLEHWSGL